MIKVSVIIPVYNAEKYLGKCLDSVINQTLKEIEIICIDDCSKDSSYLILREYQKKDTRIVVLKNETNQGVSMSRNIGLKAAKGEYIGFTDSDDIIDKDFFSNLYNTAKKYDSDTVCTNAVIRYIYDYDPISIDHTEDYEYNGKLISLLFLNTFKKYNGSLYPRETFCRIWKKKFIDNNNIDFIKTRFGEDYTFLLESLVYNPKISYNNNSIYYYIENPNSITRNKHAYSDIIQYLYNMIDRLINIYFINSKESIPYLLDRIVIEILDLYKLVDDKKQFCIDISNIIYKLIQVKGNLYPNNLMLKKIYIDLLNSKNTIDSVLSKYKLIRKILPPFLLKILRKRNIII